MEIKPFYASKKATSTGYNIAGFLGVMSSSKIGLFYWMAQGSLLKHIEDSSRNIDWSDQGSIIAAVSAMGVLSCLPTIGVIVPTWLWKSYSYSTLDMRINDDEKRISMSRRTLFGQETINTKYDNIVNIGVKKQHWLQRRNNVGTLLVTIEDGGLEKEVKIPFQDNPHELAADLKEKLVV